MSPFDQAWTLLKRQTTLGEFHPDLPSPYGSHVMHFHGTTQPAAQMIMADPGGIRPKRGVHGHGAYVSDDYEVARRYADAKAVDQRGWDGTEVKPMVLGIREGFLDHNNPTFPRREHRPTVTSGTEDWMEEGFYPYGVNPEYLTQIPADLNWSGDMQ
jgi:hypothetical protein